MATLKVTELTVYPVKSCKGTSVQQASISDVGNFHYDRHWVIVKGDGSGKFITQRQDGRLALIQPVLPVSAFSKGIIQDTDCMILKAPGQPDFSLPLSLPATLNLVDTTVWGWTGKAHDEGDKVAEWLSQYLGKPVRLVRYVGNPQDPSNPANRPVDPDGQWTDPAAYQTRFSDQFPFLVANTASLEDLNNQVQDTVIEMNRFRPNIIISGGTPWEEDTWGSIKFTTGNVELDLVKPCSRCKVPTIDQATGIDGLEPTKTMMQTRSGAALGWLQPAEFKGTVFFGTNGVLNDKGSGVVCVGDTVVVTKTLDGPIKPRIDC